MTDFHNSKYVLVFRSRNRGVEIKGGIYIWKGHSSTLDPSLNTRTTMKPLQKLVFPIVSYSFYLKRGLK